MLLARAIAQQPRLLLLDEPFNGVDAVSQEALLTALAALRAGGRRGAGLHPRPGPGPPRLRPGAACSTGGRSAFGPTAATLTPELLRAAYGGQALVAGGAVVAR